jgi:hypothetical protein
MSGDKVAYVTTDDLDPNALDGDHLSSVVDQPAVTGNGGDALSEACSGNRILPCPYGHIADFVEDEAERGDGVSPAEEALCGSVVDVVEFLACDQSAGSRSQRDTRLAGWR